MLFSQTLDLSDFCSLSEVLVCRCNAVTALELRNIRAPITISVTRCTRLESLILHSRDVSTPLCSRTEAEEIALPNDRMSTPTLNGMSPEALSELDPGGAGRFAGVSRATSDAGAASMSMNPMFARGDTSSHAGRAIGRTARVSLMQGGSASQVGALHAPDVITSNHSCHHPAPASAQSAPAFALGDNSLASLTVSQCPALTHVGVTGIERIGAFHASRCPRLHPALEWALEGEPPAVYVLDVDACGAAEAPPDIARTIAHLDMHDTADTRLSIVGRGDPARLTDPSPAAAAAGMPRLSSAPPPHAGRPPLARAALSNCALLRVVELVGCDALTSVSIAACSTLYCLLLHSNPALTEVAISSCADLAIVDVDACPVLTALALSGGCDALRAVKAASCGALASLQLGAAARLEALQLLSVPALSHFTAADVGAMHALDLSACTALAEVTVHRCAGVRTVDVRGCAALRAVRLGAAAALAKLLLGAAPTLQVLEITGAHMLADLPEALARCAALREVVVTESGLLKAVALRAPLLETLRVEGCAALRALDVVNPGNAPPRISHLDLRGCACLYAVPDAIPVSSAVTKTVRVENTGLAAHPLPAPLDNLAPGTVDRGRGAVALQRAMATASGRSANCRIVSAILASASMVGLGLVSGQLGALAAEAAAPDELKEHYARGALPRP